VLPERLRGDVERELARFGPQAGMSDLVAAWPAAVGAAIARNAWPARIARDGTVIVHAADSVWAFELGQRAGEIAARLGATRLRFVPGPLPEPAAEEPAKARRDAPRPGPREREEAARLVAGLENDELRKIVAKTVALGLARAATDRFFW
jgi:hypothetical protein